MKHKRDVLSYIKKGIDPSQSHLMMLDELNAYLHNYNNQGLYLNSGEIDNVISQINKYGSKLGVYNKVNPFTPKWWHFIYKIPRTW